MQPRSDAKATAGLPGKQCGARGSRSARQQSPLSDTAGATHLQQDKDDVIEMRPTRRTDLGVPVVVVA